MTLHVLQKLLHAVWVVHACRHVEQAPAVVHEPGAEQLIQQGQGMPGPAAVPPAA